MTILLEGTLIEGDNKMILNFYPYYEELILNEKSAELRLGKWEIGFSNREFFRCNYGARCNKIDCGQAILLVFFLRACCCCILCSTLADLRRWERSYSSRNQSYRGSHGDVITLSAEIQSEAVNSRPAARSIQCFLLVLD